MSGCSDELKWRLFEQTRVDTKDLCDIPEQWAQVKVLGLPRHQYTARGVTSGWHYLSFAQERTLAHSKLFAEVILDHADRSRRFSRIPTGTGIVTGD